MMSLTVGMQSLFKAYLLVPNYFYLALLHRLIIDLVFDGVGEDKRARKIQFVTCTVLQLMELLN